MIIFFATLKSVAVLMGIGLIGFWILARKTVPLEVLKVLHSFDPCLACAVHIIDLKGNDLGEYKINASC